MNKKLFAEFIERMTQMNEIARGERAPSREFHVDASWVKALRSNLGQLSYGRTKLIPARFHTVDDACVCLVV